jgi:hypothetical protein
LLLNVDGRSGPARRFRDLVTSLIQDLGGIENISTVRLGLVRRLAAVSVLCEISESAAARGEAVDITQFCTLASTSVRLSARLGLERRAKLIVPSVEQYVAHLSKASVEKEVDAA